MPTPATFAETVELLQRAQAGDGACLGRVLERYRERLLVRIRVMMGSGARRFAESGDVLQGVFVKILEHFDGFEMRDEDAFLRWATRIARNGIRDDLCRKREIALESLASESALGPPHSTRDGTPSQAVERVEQIDRLVDALSELQEDQRCVIELRHFEQLPFAEIGRRLQRSENAVQLLHTRVLLRLGQVLRDRDDG